MDLSVIIPTYNRKDLLLYTLESLNIKLHPNVKFEIIIVDDNSTDGTAEFVMDKFPGSVFVKNAGQGAAMARNQGLQMSTGKYILFLDSDDIIGPGFFGRKFFF